MKEIGMRKGIFLLIVILSLTTNLWAADPIIGTWKLNIEKSRGTEGMDSPAKEITYVYRETDSGLIEVDQKRVFMDNTSDSGLDIFPAQGGAFLTQGIEGIFLFEVYLGPGEWCGIYIQDGKQIVTRHKVVSDDGKTLTETLRFIDEDGDDGGGLVEIIQVFERQ
jgi:hypothetical protein